ncbi:hypothetical protein JCM33774_35820 [Actinophytocola sp. KF-1]
MWDPLSVDERESEWVAGAHVLRWITAPAEWIVAPVPGAVVFHRADRFSPVRNRGDAARTRRMTGSTGAAARPRSVVVAHVPLS